MRGEPAVGRGTDELRYVMISSLSPASGERRQVAPKSSSRERLAASKVPSALWESEVVRCRG